VVLSFKQAAFTAAWKYFLYVIVMKNVINIKEGFKKGPEAKIYNYLRDNHANIDSNPIGTIISYLKRLEGIKIGKFEASLKAKELEKLYRLEDIVGLLDDLDSICAEKMFLY
jgi:hypothetical protein